MKPQHLRHRSDLNQREIVVALRGVPGVEVFELGRPLDLLVGWRERNFLLEVKGPGEKIRTPAQQDFWNRWTGQKAIVHTVDEAFRAIGMVN